MLSLSALLSGCVCAAVLVCLVPHVRVCSAAPAQRDSRFVLPTSPSEATWVYDQSIIKTAPQAAAAGAGSFVRARGSDFVVQDIKVVFFAGTNSFFVALRRESGPMCCGKL